MNSINTSERIEELHSNCEILDPPKKNVDVNVDVNICFNLICSTYSLMQGSYFFKIL